MDGITFSQNLNCVASRQHNHGAPLKAIVAIFVVLVAAAVVRGASADDGAVTAVERPVVAGNDAPLVVDGESVGDVFGGGGRSWCAAACSAV